VKALSRRTVLRGLGATVALPLLDAMLPARASAATATRVRLICIEMVHGAAGSAPIGVKKNLWAPAATGRDFDLAPTSLRSLEPLRDHLTIVSNCDVESADPFTASEIGGDHFRSSAVFLTQSHPKQTQGADVEAGISLDQLYASRFGGDTPLPSIQLCIEPVDQAGGCGYGYSCVYTDAISWASPTRPLPMIRSPRLVFEELFGVYGSGATREERRLRRRDDRSILDWVLRSAARLSATLGPSDRARLGDYLEQVREIERRLQRVEAMNGSGEPRDLPEAPVGIPDSFSEHVALMFDLVLLAFRSDLTRVVSFKTGTRQLEPRLSGERLHRPVSQRVAPRRPRRSHPRFRAAQHLPCQPASPRAREAPRRGGRGTHAARPKSAALRIADGRLEPAQPQARAVLRRGARRRSAQGRRARQGAERDAAGQRDADAAPYARAGRFAVVRRQ
jgi:uncharacterized protein DUF1552